MAEDGYQWVIPTLQIIVIPIVLVILGFFVQSAIKQKDINSRLVELSINILSESPSKEKVPIRTWAVDVINKFSEVKFDEKSKNLLIYNAHFAWEMRDDLEMTDDMIMGKPHFIESPPKK